MLVRSGSRLMLPLASLLGLVFCSLNGGHHDDDDDVDMNRRHSPEIKKKLANYGLLLLIIFCVILWRSEIKSCWRLATVFIMKIVRKEKVLKYAFVGLSLNGKLIWIGRVKCDIWRRRRHSELIASSLCLDGGWNSSFVWLWDELLRPAEAVI